MRMLLFFLIVLNLLYAGWEYVNPTYSEKQLVPMADDLKPLQLLRETVVIPEVKEIAIIEPSVAEAAVGVISESPAQQLTEEIKSTDDSVACYTLGPFKDKNIMQQLSDSIAESVDGLEIRKRKESEKHRYWVHVPALPSRKQAKVMAQKLRDKKITDFYIVLKGGAKNSISLGHFREPQHANRRMRGVAKKGFNVETEVIYRTYDLYWLDYQLDMDKSPDFSIDEYITDGVSQLDRVCENESNL